MPIVTLAWGFLLLLAGCAGTGEVIPLDVQAMPSTKSLNQNFQDIKVVLERFEEGPEAKRIGVRSHLGGGETIFTAQGGGVGDAVARVVADNLKSMGFQVWIKKSGASELPANPDVTITGEVHQVLVRARSRFFSTKLMGKVKVTIQAANASDRSTVRLNLEGGREDLVFWFKPEHVQELVNRMLKENLDRLLADVRVQNRALLTK
jgi:uncharacterized lipoprotein YajG